MKEEEEVEYHQPASPTAGSATAGSATVGSATVGSAIHDDL